MDSSDTPDIDNPDAAKAYLNGVTSHIFRMGDTSYLHPDFAVRLAKSMQDARAAGLNVSLESGYRPKDTTGSAYDMSGLSLHDKGAAADIRGLGYAGSPAAQQWAQIAAKNGIYNPYGISNPAEFNHWQLVPYKLEDRPDVQKSIADAGGDLSKVWNAVQPISSDALGYLGQGSSKLASNASPASFLSDFPVSPTQAAATASKAPPAFLKDFEVAPAVPAPSTAPAAAPAPANPSQPDALRDFAISPGKTVNDPNLAIQPNDPRLQPGYVGPKAAPDPGIGQQLVNHAEDAVTYAGGQVLKIPGAIADDWRNATALNAQGNAESASGHDAPSFPSWDPRTWSPGGAIKSTAGLMGQIASPLTGAVRELVQDPVTQATGDPSTGERAGFVANALAGGPLSRVAGAVPGAVGNALVGSVDAETANLANLARGKWKIPVTAPQISGGSSGITSSALNRLPFSGADKVAEAQADAWNHGVASTIGEDATRLTPDVMNAARTRIGGYYNGVASRTNLNVDPQFLQDLHDTLNDASKVLQKSQTEPLIKQTQEILGTIDPNAKTISGKTYQALTNNGAPLDKLTDSTDPSVAFYANRIKQALDGALQRSATPEDQALLKTADKQWAALKTIQPLAAKAPTGQISPALLAGRVNANTGNGMAFGFGGDLGELARIGQKFLKEPGSSNTAERASALATIYGLGKAAAGTGLGLMGLHGAGYDLPAMTPGTLAATAATVPAALAIGRAGGSALRSNWLANSLINRSLNRLAPSADIGPFSALTSGGGAASLLDKPVNALAPPNQQP